MYNAKAYSAGSATSPLASTTIERRDPTPPPRRQYHPGRQETVYLTRSIAIAETCTTAGPGSRPFTRARGAGGDRGRVAPSPTRIEPHRLFEGPRRLYARFEIRRRFAHRDSRCLPPAD